MYESGSPPRVESVLMADVFDCTDNSQLLAGMRSARQSLGRAQLVVIPTDTVYGIAADAFSAAAVRKLLNAKGRTAKSPPPVLIASVDQLDALTAEVPAPVRRLAEELWPGALTIVLQANPSLSWHLGETGGTVALRIPDQELTLELLRETGPLAVSSANKTGEPAARTMAEAREALGTWVSVYLDAGEAAGDGAPSTIVDATDVTDDGGEIRVLRDGAISRERIAELVPEVALKDPVPQPPDPSGQEETVRTGDDTLVAADGAEQSLEQPELADPPHDSGESKTER